MDLSNPSAAPAPLWHSLPPLGEESSNPGARGVRKPSLPPPGEESSNPGDRGGRKPSSLTPLLGLVLGVGVSGPGGLCHQLLGQWRYLQSLRPDPQADQ